MSRVLTRCPTNGEVVPTGHRTQDFALAEMVISRSFRCPRCQKVHAWTREEAWPEVAQAAPA